MIGTSSNRFHEPTLQSRSLLLFLLLSLWAAVGHAETEFKFVTDTGYVAFTAEDSWTVLGMQSKLPIAAATFQIPNRADEGTPDSTNVAVSFYQLTSPQAAEVMSKIGKQYGAEPPRQGTHGEWKTYTQDAKQGATPYTIVDATRHLDSVAANVRITWPHLKANAADYDRQMGQLLLRVIDSVREFVGAYVPEENEVIRRPDP